MPPPPKGTYNGLTTTLADKTSVRQGADPARPAGGSFSDKIRPSLRKYLIDYRPSERVPPKAIVKEKDYAK